MEYIYIIIEKQNHQTHILDCFHQALDAENELKHLQSLAHQLQQSPFQYEIIKQVVH